MEQNVPESDEVMMEGMVRLISANTIALAEAVARTGYCPACFGPLHLGGPCPDTVAGEASG